MGKTVAKTLALPEIGAIRARLLPELPVYGVGEEDGVELATFGIVDALCIGENGKPELVINWKSDVAPSAAAPIIPARRSGVTLKPLAFHAD